MMPMTEAATPTTEVALPDVPLDVIEFAGEHDAVWNLRPLVTITRTAFPARPIHLRLEADPEIADDRRIVIEVDITGWDAEQTARARDQWAELFLKVTMPSQVGVFRLRMVQQT
jgi:hypothetical protein